MARPWKLVFYLPTSPNPGSEGESDVVAPATFERVALRILERDLDYRMAFDRELGMWAVYVRHVGAVSPEQGT